MDAETFAKVQGILKGKRNGERNRQHPHYLKSTLYCGQCDMRMIVQVAKARKGDEYPYYSCLGRHFKRTTCDLRSISIVNMEDRAVRPTRAPTTARRHPPSRAP
ncbi:zinc ribbon domain-containing protein [Microbacterium sp.]|uniref:zinc ribbon domain-containing protein n=1 Tax=Microbacterium sp. TaxID=51671 RepID=UPI003F993EC7